MEENQFIILKTGWTERKLLASAAHILKLEQYREEAWPLHKDDAYSWNVYNFFISSTDPAFCTNLPIGKTVTLSNQIANEWNRWKENDKY